MTAAPDAFRVCILSSPGDLPPAARQVWLKAGASQVDVRDFDSLAGLGSVPPDLFVVRAGDDEIGLRLRELASLVPSVPVAAWSRSPTVQGAVEAIRAGAIDYLSAITSPDGIKSLIHKAKARRLAEPEAEGGDDEWPSLLGESAPMKKLLREVQAVARHDATVLLQGETGTGKERVARLVHRLSQRATKPFVVCNCSAVVSTLAESELFGHERGAFTGARKAKAGLFEAARGGTLFFDQVQELPLSLQPKLLRILENREFSRLGSGRPIKTDVRVIAAANRDLKEEVREKRFREDLFYRMNTATLTIPPLRERREDIPLLVEHFLAVFSKQFGKPVRMISREAMSFLMAHPWEGNVRELRNLVERAVAVSRRRVLTRRDLRLPAPRRASGDAPELAPAELISLDELERRQIRKVLEMTGGNREQAARALGVSRSTLYRRLSDLGL